MTQMDEMGCRILWFTGKMFAKLALPKNTRKTDARDMLYPELLERLIDEVHELDDAIHRACKDHNDATDFAVISECSDVANFAMMIADKIHFERGKQQ